MNAKFLLAFLFVAVVGASKINVTKDEVAKNAVEQNIRAEVRDMLKAFTGNTGGRTWRPYSGPLGVGRSGWG